LMTSCGVMGGMGNLGVCFHVREQRRLRAALAQRDCLKRVPLLPGDYDANGTLGRADLVAATAVLTQGFRSLGADAPPPPGRGARRARAHAALQCARPPARRALSEPRQPARGPPIARSRFARSPSRGAVDRNAASGENPGER
jgi:hypothetical protein